MKFKHKSLVFAVSMALCSGSGWATTTVKPNTKAFPLGATNYETGIGRRIVANKTATIGADDFITAWLEKTPTTKIIYGRYTQNGTANGNRFKIGTLDSSSLDETRIAVDRNDNGDAVACWTDAQDAGASVGIYCQLVPQGTSVDLATVPIQINAKDINTASALHGPTVAMDDSGEFIVAWHAADSIWARRFSSSGVALKLNPSAIDTDEVLVADQSSDSPATEAPSIAIDRDGGSGSDGDAVIAWNKSSQIYAQRISKTISQTFPASGLQVDLTPADDNNFADDNKTVAYSTSNPSVAMDNAGNFAVTWQRNRVDGKRKKSKTGYGYSYTSSSGIFAQRFDASDNSQNKNTKTGLLEDLAIQNKSKQVNVTPEIAMDDTGNFVVGWEQDKIKGKCFPYDTDNNGGYTYCYSYSLGSSVMARKYGIEKNKLDGAKTAVKSSAKVSQFNTGPAVALDNAGNFEVMWTGTDTDPYYGYSPDIKSSAMVKLYPGKK